MISTDEQKIYELLTRGVEEIFVKEDLERKLKSGEQLRVKFGIDPTSSSIHLGRAVVLRKLKAFQDLGHQVVIIVGDFTAKIGDPSDKLEKRPMLTNETIQENLKTYREQIAKVIDPEKAEWHYNNDWLGSMNIIEGARLMECFTVQQMSKRRNFKDRLDSDQDIFLNEFMYPAFQGYDSYKIKADVEIGGFDQLFNLKAGRIVQKKFGQEQQDIMTLSMLEGTDGQKMSSSWGNIIAILDSANDMFGKTMALRDDLITKYFLLCTDLSQEEILDMEVGMQNGENPMQYKKRLAREIVTIYHNEVEAVAAQENWEKTFSEGGVPDEIPHVTAVAGSFLMDVVAEAKLVESKAEFRRLVDEGAVKIMHENDEEKIEDQKFPVTETIIVKIGKRKFLKVSV